MSFYWWENRLNWIKSLRQGPSGSAVMVSWCFSPSLTWAPLCPSTPPGLPPQLKMNTAAISIVCSKPFFDSLKPNTLHLKCSASTVWPHCFLVHSTPPACLLTLLHFLLLPDAHTPSPLSPGHPSPIKGSAVFSAIPPYITAPTSK